MEGCICKQETIHTTESRAAAKKAAVVPWLVRLSEPSGSL